MQSKLTIKKIVSRICSSVEKQFAEIEESPIFRKIEILLEAKYWPIDKDSSNFGDEVVKEISLFKNYYPKTIANLTTSCPNG